MQPSGGRTQENVVTKNGFRIAAAQVGGIGLTDQRSVVVARLVDMMREASARGASFVIYPELALTTFFPRYRFDSRAELLQFFEREMPSEATRPLFDCAREHGVGFYLGYAELTEDGHHFNTSILVDRAGSIVGKYRKIHLPGHREFKDTAQAQHLEKRYFEVGDLGFRVWDTCGMRMGMALCNDRRWPEVYRMLSLQSADLVMLGYNTPSQMIDWTDQPHQTMFHHLLSLQAGAYQNSVWVVATAKCGLEDGHHMIGGSAIVAPSGEIVARAATEEDELVLADVDVAMARQYRENVFDFERHRQPDQYGLIVQRRGRGEPLPRPRRD